MVQPQKNACVEPLRRYEPSTLDEVIDIVSEAREGGCTVRAVGSGHSWSDVALTPGDLVETHKLSRPLEVDCVRANWDGPPLARVEAGMRIRELNELQFGPRRAERRRPPRHSDPPPYRRSSARGAQNARPRRKRTITAVRPAARVVDANVQRAELAVRPRRLGRQDLLGRRVPRA